MFKSLSSLASQHVGFLFVFFTLSEADVLTRSIGSPVVNTLPYLQKHGLSVRNARPGIDAPGPGATREVDVLDHLTVRDVYVFNRFQSHPVTWNYGRTFPVVSPTLLVQQPSLDANDIFGCFLCWKMIFPFFLPCLRRVAQQADCIVSCVLLSGSSSSVRNGFAHNIFSE